MKIIHTGDIHLDSKLESNLPPQKAKQRKNELLFSFSRMVNFAIDNNVSVVILAGDIFDGSKVTIKTRDFFYDCIQRAKDIDFLYLVGNHDEYASATKDRDIPSNLKIFGNQWTTFEYDEVSIKGLILTENNYASFYDSLVNDEDKFNINVLHGQVSSSVGHELIKISELKNKHIDYLALGHLHTHSIDKIDDRGIYSYCGCLEGRGFDECGQKGFVLLDVNDKKLDLSFHSLSNRTLHEIEVDISGLITLSQILDKVNNSLNNIPSCDLVKVVLTGTYNTDTQKNLDVILEQLNSKFYFAKIKDKSSLEINIDEYKNDISLKGEFIRSVLSSDLSKEDKDSIIMCGIKALSGEDVE